MPTDPRVDAYIVGVEPALQPVMRAARAAIRRAAPGLEECMCRGLPHWRGAGWVAYLAAHAQHVNLGLHRGAELRSPLLEGTGKALRHIKLRSAADARRPQVLAAVAQAAALDARTQPVRRAAASRR